MNAQKMRSPLLTLLLITVLAINPPFSVVSTSSSSEFSEQSSSYLRRKGIRAIFSSFSADAVSRNLQGFASPTQAPSSLPTMAPSSSPTVPNSAPPSTSPPTPTTIPVSASPSSAPTQSYTNYSQSLETPSASPSSTLLASWGASRSDTPSTAPSLIPSKAPHTKRPKPPHRTSKPTPAPTSPQCVRALGSCQFTSQCCQNPSTPPLSCQWSKCTKCSPLGKRCGWNFNCCSNSCVQGVCVKQTAGTTGKHRVPAPTKRKKNTKNSKNKNNKNRMNRKKQRKSN